MRILKINALLRIILCVFVAYIYVEKAYSEPFNIIVSADVKRDYLRFLDGRDPLSIKDFSSPYSRRDVVEMLLLEQALSLGGNQSPYKILTSTTTTTDPQSIEAGRVQLIGTSVWKSMFTDPDKVLFSTPMIKDGQFEAGLYTSPKNRAMLKVKSKQNLRRKSVISSRMWTVDWQTLNDLNVGKVWHTDKWKDMVKMVNTQRVDFLLAPFQSSKDLAMVINDVRLVPVKGVKIGLKGTRHFAVSKKAANSQQLLDYVNTGIAKLNAEGLIDKAYNQSGFYNQQVKDWILIN